MKRSENLENKTLADDSGYSSEESMVPLTVPPISESSRPAWQIFTPLLHIFVVNVSYVRNNMRNYTIIPCLYPSRIMSTFLTSRDNFRLEYFVLFNDQMVNYLMSIISGTYTLRQNVSNSTHGSLQEGIHDSIIISRDFLIQIYSNLFTEIPMVIIENNIIGQFSTIVERLNRTEITDGSLLSFEICAFLCSMIVNLPSDQWSLFIESILSSSGATDNSVHHYQMIFSAWGAENNTIPYSDFQPILVQNAEIYKGIHASFYNSTFNATALSEVTQIASAATQSSVLNTTTRLDNLVILSNDVILTLGSQQLAEIDNISTRDYIPTMSYISYCIYWAFENRILLGSAFMLVGGVASLLRPPLIEWCRGSSHNTIERLEHLQVMRSDNAGPLLIPEISMPIIPSIPIPSVPAIDSIFDVILPTVHQVGVAGGIFVVTVLFIKKSGLSKVLYVMWSK
jgi:hypothetical protein